MWAQGVGVPVPSPTIITVVLGSAPGLPLGCSPWFEQVFCLAHLASSSVMRIYTLESKHFLQELTNLLL